MQRQENDEERRCTILFLFYALANFSIVEKKRPNLQNVEKKKKKKEKKEDEERIWKD